ncbi:hypothetical protein KKB69_01925 [Patescibacteria group bacterium]|nr:hypothetical protein [Patescibacteria group bacterium]
MRKEILKFLFGCVILVLLAFFQNARAFGENVSISIVPQNPTPGSPIKAQIYSSGFDASRSNIIWRIGDKTTEKGIGKTSIETVAPDAGKSKTISVSVTTENDIQLTKTLILQGNDVDLLCEAMTCAPYWYNGLPLPVIDSRVKAVAIPHLFSGGKRILPSNLFYEWSLNYEGILNSSGYKKNSFSFKIENYNNYAVTVKVSNADKSAVFEKTIILPANQAKPEIIFYEDNPSLGTLFNKAIKGEFQMLVKTINIIAEPFFFSNPEKLDYNWKMNGQNIAPEENNPKVMNFETPTGITGTGAINLQIKNLANFFQFAEESLNINF